MGNLSNYLLFSALLIVLFANYLTAVSPSSNSTITSNSSKNATVPVSAKQPAVAASEGGPINIDSTHSGREHVSDKPPEVPKVTPTNVSSSINNTKLDRPPISNTTVTKPTVSLNTTNVKPVTEKVEDFVIPKKQDHKNSMPKKGVEEFPHNISSSTETPKPKTTKKIHKKPLFTESDEGPVPQSDLETSKQNESKLHPPKHSMDDEIKKNKQSDYIVPIVAVILSVPLVAIVISFLYKRGADWWQHRNYRRMDFLIEGMYNN